MLLHSVIELNQHDWIQYGSHWNECGPIHDSENVPVWFELPPCNEKEGVDLTQPIPAGINSQIVVPNREQEQHNSHCVVEQYHIWQGRNCVWLDKQPHHVNDHVDYKHFRHPHWIDNIQKACTGSSHACVRREQRQRLSLPADIPRTVKTPTIGINHKLTTSWI